MPAVDTNVLVRLITRDDARQTQQAEQVVAKGAWVSQLVLAETVWVLDSVYGLDAGKIATAMEMLLQHAQLSLQDPDLVQAALAQFRKHPGVGFTDCLILESARKPGHTPLVTFDRALSALPGVKRLPKT